MEDVMIFINILKVNEKLKNLIVVQWIIKEIL